MKKYRNFEGEGGEGAGGKTGGQEKAFITELTDLNNSDFVTK